MTQVDLDPQISSSIIGRAVASTVVTMAEMGSIGQDILDLHGITEIDPLAWYPYQLRREIHVALSKGKHDTRITTRRKKLTIFKIWSSQSYVARFR